MLRFMLQNCSRAGYIKKRMKGKRLSGNTYLTEAEPFLKQFAERSAKNQQLVGAAGVHIDVENFLAQVTRERRDGEEDEYIPDEEQVIAPNYTTSSCSIRKSSRDVGVFSWYALHHCHSSRGAPLLLWF